MILSDNGKPINKGSTYDHVLKKGKISDSVVSSLFERV